MGGVPKRDFRSDPPVFIEPSDSRMIAVHHCQRGDEMPSSDNRRLMLGSRKDYDERKGCDCLNLGTCSTSTVLMVRGSHLLTAEQRLVIALRLDHL